MKAKPFVKWVGGKTQLLSRLLELAPKEFKTYHEPFLGGGALFFALEPKNAYLTDTNARLINAFRCVRDDLQGVVANMQGFSRTVDCYYKQRDALNHEGSLFFHDPVAAARFIFLNKTCYNGLWRENAGGGLNVPYGGDRKKARFLDESNLLACSIALRMSNVYFNAEDFGEVAKHVDEGDFVYFDPPYIPLTATSFVDYTAGGFGSEEQVRLRNLAADLKNKGVHVMLSNSDTAMTRQLYKGFELHEVQARRSVNSNGAGRGRVGELIIK